MNLTGIHRLTTAGVPQTQGGARTQEPAAGKPVQRGSFAGIFQEKLTGCKLSAHAQSRLASRNIQMTPEMMGKLDKAVNSAAVKGANNSLVMMSGLAFIVNVPSRTVVTAMDGESVRDNVFTNIDSAVIAG